MVGRDEPFCAGWFGHCAAGILDRRFCGEHSHHSNYSVDAADAAAHSFANKILIKILDCIWCVIPMEFTTHHLFLPVLIDSFAAQTAVNNSIALVILFVTMARSSTVPNRNTTWKNNRNYAIKFLQASIERCRRIKITCIILIWLMRPAPRRYIPIWCGLKWIDTKYRSTIDLLVNIFKILNEFGLFVWFCVENKNVHKEKL